MKIKLFVFGLLLLISCKDGGGLTNLSPDKSLGWAFNQALISNNFSSTSSTKFSNGGSNQFTFSSSNYTFVITTKTPACNPISSTVKIDNVTSSFEPATCGISLASYYDSQGILIEKKEFYFLYSTRVNGNTLEYISLGFLGSSLKNNLYQFSPYYPSDILFCNYNSFVRNLDGTTSNYDSFYPVGGSVSTSNLNGNRAFSNYLLMSSTRNYSTKQFSFDIGCCSN